MSGLIDLEDTLGEACSFTQAIFLAAAGLSDGHNTCAIQMVAGQIADRLEKARSIIDELHAQLVIPADVAPQEMLKALKAEKARRAALRAEEEHANG